MEECKIIADAEESVHAYYDFKSQSRQCKTSLPLSSVYVERLTLVSNEMAQSRVLGSQQTKNKLKVKVQLMITRSGSIRIIP